MMENNANIKMVDVVVAGAGPAGSMCGYLLRKAGIDCLLIDRATFPRDKICGGGLTSKTWHLLERLMPDLRYEFNPVTHVKLDIDGEVQCAFDIEEPIRIVQRKVFDHALLQQYLAIGGQFLQDAVLEVEETDDQVVVILRSGERIACRYLVGADGSNSKVRRYLKSDTDRGILAMEQYVEKNGSNDIEVGLSQKYDIGGYYFRFPNTQFDVVGFGDYSTTPERFQQVMREKGYEKGQQRGAYIYLSNDYPLNDRIILIGDAGGFANRSTCEGLYDAFVTAQHAATAIVENRPFREVNAPVFRKMRKEVKVTKVFFSRLGFRVLKWMCKHPSWVKWCFDTKMRRETWIRK